LSSSTQSGTEGAGTGGYRPPRPLIKLIIAIVAVLVVSNVVTGLAVYYASLPPVSGAKVVTVVGPWAGNEKDAFLPVMDQFARTTGISYTFTTTRQEDLQTSLPNQFAAGQSPADLIFMPSAFIKTYAGQGYVTSLTGTIGPSTYKPGALDQVTANSAIWGGAYTGKVKPGFWYRVSFFQAHGLTPPTTWSQFTTLLANLKVIAGVKNPIISGDGVGWPLSDVTEHFIATYGGASMHQALTAKTLKWTDTSVHDLFATYLVPTLQAGDWSEPITWDSPGVNLFWNGTYPLYFMGSWITGMVSDPSDLGVFSLPGGVANQGIVFAADYFFVPKFAAHPVEAKRLAAFFASAAAQTTQVRQGGHIATAAGVSITAYPSVDARVAGLLTGKTVLPDLDDTIGGTFQTTFWSQLQLLWSDPTKLDSVLSTIQAAT